MKKKSENDSVPEIASNDEMPQASEQLLLIDKPKGISSFDVIRILRRELGIKKMGHAGTLDPLASGLMLIGVGAGTKLLADLIGLPKTYEVIALLGRRTTTGDMEGDVLEESHQIFVTEADIKSVLENMRGDLILPVPIYSAVKRGGVPLYKKARKGQTVEAPMRIMHIDSIDLHSIKEKDGQLFVSITMDVASGVYVRSVIEELGMRLRVPATTYELRRTRIGLYSVEQARKIKKQGEI